MALFLPSFLSFLPTGINMIVNGLILHKKLLSVKHSLKKNTEEPNRNFMSFTFVLLMMMMTEKKTSSSAILMKIALEKKVF
jgi:hypothetical protein